MLIGLSVLHIPRVVLQYFSSQHFAVDVCVYLGSGDAFMPQHLLDDAEVGAPFEQVRGK